MNVKRIVKQFGKICDFSFRFLGRIFHLKRIPVGAILMFHRIDYPDENGIKSNQHLKMSPDSVSLMIEYAKKKGCRFVSIDEFADAMRLGKYIHKWIAVTLDDGYADNFYNGKAVFEDHNVPYCIYVCSKMVERKMLYWWNILEDIILKNEFLELFINNKKIIYDCSSRDAKDSTFLELRELILQMPQKTIVDEMKKLFANYNVDFELGNTEVNSLGLSWEQLKIMAQSPLVTIGNHTYSHYAFSMCSDSQIIEDVGMAQALMKGNIGYDMNHFAFPFGEDMAVSKHDIDLVSDMGFKTSVTVRSGYVCYDSDLLNLPRLFVTEGNWKKVIDKICKNC